MSVASRNVIPRKLPERPKSPYGSSTAETDLADTSGGLVTMSSGNGVEVIGAVVDAQFPRVAVPKVYEALKVENGLTLRCVYLIAWASEMGHKIDAIFGKYEGERTCGPNY